jgi:hypothetical protein
MLFNVTTKKVFKCIEHDQAITCRKSWGPCFGSTELGAYEPFNGDYECWSYAENSGYKIGKDSERRSMLTNLKDNGLSNLS